MARYGRIQRLFGDALGVAAEQQQSLAPDLDYGCLNYNSTIQSTSNGWPPHPPSASTHRPFAQMLATAEESVAHAPPLAGNKS